MRSLHLLGAAASLASLASAQVTLTEIVTIDLDSTANSANPEFIGSNPSAITWDGLDLYVAGFNASGATADVGIVQVATPVLGATIGTAYGIRSAPNLRGYSGLDTKPIGFAAQAAVVAAYDSGASDPNGIALYDGPSGTQMWARNARGGSGVGWDPGFPGGTNMGIGAAWTTFGSGRRALQDTLTGADNFTTANGMIILTSEGTFWRDMDFDDATGDVYLREGNNLISWERTGDNSVANSAILFDPTDSDFVNGQNVAFLGGQDAVVFNDRSSTAGGQSFFDVVKFVRPDGTPMTANYGGFAPATGVGYYDFSYDRAGRTLAILDFANRNAHIFAVEVGVGNNYCMTNPNSTGVPARILGTGSAALAGPPLFLSTFDMPANSFSIVITSQTQGFMANPGGSEGNICLAGSVGRAVGGVQNSGSTGFILVQVDWSAIPQPMGTVSAMAGDTWNFQTWMRDSVGGVSTSNFSDAVSVTVE